MPAPFVAEAPNLMARQSHTAAPVEFEGEPRMPAAEMIALSFVNGLPRESLYSLLRGAPNASDTPSYGQAPGPAAGACPGDPLEDLLVRLGCRDAGRRAADARGRAQRALLAASAAGIETLPWGAALYPPLLGRIFDPPLVLWVRGSIQWLSASAVAIVGSRNASPYGEEAAGRLASDLASRGLVIVSGLARGIDAAAHRGALAAAGRTVAVLGCGANVVYPPEHGELMERVLRGGAVVSEFPPGTAPMKMNFPRRNRIISGLSRVVVVVEARQRSGALITADCALEQGRDVMAVPGNVLSERHRGSHTLLKAGAALVESAADVLEALHVGGSPSSAAEADRDPLLAMMEFGEGYEVDALAAMSGEAVATLLPRLLALELQGRVRRLPGGRFGRVRGTC